MEIAAFMSSVKIAYDLAQGIASLKTLVERDQAVSKILEVLRTVQTDALLMQREHAALTARVEDIEKENIRLKDWTAEKARYVRKRIGGGVFVYTEQEVMETPEEAYKLCCSCFDNTIKSVLQSKRANRAIHFVCPRGCPDLEVRDWNNKFI